ncbi:lysine N(6)-hydroxylase/L-ornithine N(5)-oxygenase family protein [Pseudonocardia parietis]|uniref:L-lysine N6-monooxygenase MbtG n=1 Tax=Pseudonocardia parietis TaxID=570936 RepID=A0ABS4VY31_9PSEU|nr:SidA/IucD/PvdA family monooxygenase [Pseudonocardia parietis]MBP2368862.1 L-ornithine N5-oxygenase [Pseudonocardia parietis]
MATPANVHPHSDEEILDVVGVGFGPSNLGVAIALLEHNASVPAKHRVTARFVERQARFGWHRGMLLEDATMQVSYLKDLVTLRNPTSGFSFLAYLHDRERLADFINYGSSFPTRREFHDYLEWAAARVVETGAAAGGNIDVDYGREVVEIAAVPGDGGTVDAVDVVVRTGERVERLRARNVILACGLTPVLPDGVRLGGRVWHNRDLLFRTRELSGTEPARFAVVGAGQSAAETVAHLHRTFPTAEVHAVFARYGYSPADDSSFANRIFDPAAVDDFYTAPEEVKGRILGYHANTNYSVVDPELIEDLYRTHYHERVAGAERLRFRNVSRVADVVDVGDRVELAVESLIDGSREVISAEAVVYATGYRATDPLALLGDGLGPACGRDEQGRLDVRRDYRLDTGTLTDGSRVRAGIYLQGPTEHTHGITSTLLSNIAVRSGEIVASLTGAPAPVAVAAAAAV